MQTATYNRERKRAEYISLEKFRELVCEDTEKFCAKHAVSNAPEGYMTLEEFRIEAKASLTKILNERGIY